MKLGVLYTQQPYKENMNKETVIHSKLLHYDHFYLVMLWPNSFFTLGKVSCYQQPIPNLPHRRLLSSLTSGSNARKINYLSS